MAPLEPSKRVGGHAHRREDSRAFSDAGMCDADENRVRFLPRYGPCCNVRPSGALHRHTMRPTLQPGIRAEHRDVRL